ncbi:FadR/GntR family transcriptional regulator [Rhizobium sp.]
MGIRGMGGSVTYDVTHHLGRSIIGGAYPPGAILPNEAEICEQFDVGRSAVREAVKMLAAKGLVDSRPGRGTQVLPSQGWNFFDRDVLTWLREGNPQPALIVELLQLRLGVEPKAAELAAENGTDEQISAISRAYDQMCAAANGRVDPVAADGSFHEAIMIGTNNRFFQPFGPLIRTALTVTAPTTNAIFGHSVGDLVAHKATLDAIQSRSPEKARSCMLDMLGAVLDAVEDWRRNPNEFVRRQRSEGLSG